MSQSVRATLMRTYDEKKLGRRHYQAEVEGAAGVAFHLIEHRRAHLWYLVIPGKDHGFHVVPLFPSEAFADQSSATIGTVPIPEEH